MIDMFHFTVLSLTENQWGKTKGQQRLKKTMQYSDHIKLVLATGQGKPPAGQVLACGMVWFGLVPEPAKNPNRICLGGCYPARS